MTLLVRDSDTGLARDGDTGLARDGDGGWAARRRWWAASLASAGKLGMTSWLTLLLLISFMPGRAIQAEQQFSFHRIGTLSRGGAACCLPTKESGAQQQEPTVSLQVKAVSVLAAVRDKHGNIVRNLSRDDFQIEEDGRPQVINYFGREKELPLHLGLLVDTSFSQRGVLDQEREASEKFLTQVLRPERDAAFVINFDLEVTLQQDFTGALAKLQAALNLLQAPRPTLSSRGERRGGWGESGGTLLYDAVYLAADELMSKKQGRKSLIILSDGVDRGSKETVDEAIETAQRADTVIYSILFADPEGYGQEPRRYGAPRPKLDRPNGKAVLEEISQKTGGRRFQVSKKESIEKIYAEIDDELRNQYSLGYTPEKGATAGYHKIRVTTRQKDLRVQARDGYYGGP